MVILKIKIYFNILKRKKKCSASTETSMLFLNMKKYLEKDSIQEIKYFKIHAFLKETKNY